jgi:hypothetical protein
MRRALLLAFAPALGCAAIIGLEDKLPPLDDVSQPLADSSIDRRLEDGALVPVDGDAIADQDSGVDAGDAADATVTIDCLGVQRNAFFCDGFEQPTIVGAWQQIVQPSAPPAELSATILRKISGTRSLASGFNMLPDGGAAVLRWPKPGAPGRLSLQVTFFFFNDAWGANDMVPLAALLSNGSPVATLLWKHTVNENGNVELRVPGHADVLLGPMAAEGWTCFEIQADGAKVRAWAGQTEKFPSPPLTTPVDGVEVGMRWLYGPDNTNSKFIGADDVVIADAPIGCLH